MEIKSTRHTVYHIAYHLVWVTKYRRTILTRPRQKALKEILRQIASERGYEIMDVETMTDHVHCFVSAPPKVAPSTIVKVLKGISAKRMFERFPALRSRMNQGHLWHSSSYIGTAGHVSAATIQRYIQEQWKRA